ncbi:DMT family transporter [Pontibacter cellulosilyticus]|uniref:DMT family transporter n=1 Tax=Pontibacter cellulosilyticus TaxID=1720253 RepID=A0A923SH33_9BACT|nr:DMT family transporter [Pontibacter cellulosilyticus]MBC5991253.1 DMT family transporter [Pontibacter cellulosilyticus]
MPQVNFNWIILLPILAGAAVATQTALNGQLRVVVNSPLLAALISFSVGTLVLVTLVLLTKQEIPQLSQLSGAPWYKFAGGFLGAFFITSVIVSVQRMSVANLLAMVVAGQLITALLFDHFGLLGIKQNSLTLTRALGAIALIIGAYLINRK